MNKIKLDNIIESEIGWVTHGSSSKRGKNSHVAVEGKPVPGKETTKIRMIEK